MAYKYLDETGLAYFWGKLKGYFQEKADTGWISLVPYINTGFAARSTSGSYMPAYRIINGVVYFKGYIYSTSAKSTTNGTILTNLPSAIAPTDERAFAGKRISGSLYSIRYESGSIIVQDAENIGSQHTYAGYGLACMCYPLN